MPRCAMAVVLALAAHLVPDGAFAQSSRAVAIAVEVGRIAGVRIAFDGLPRTGARHPTPALPGTAVGARVLPTARRYLGVRYRYGGTSPRTGFDCSGFVQYVFARHDVRLPRTSRQQASAGLRVPARVAALRPGDLMLFAERGARISHVAIYAGGNRMIHSSSSGGGVRHDDLTTSRGRWFVQRMVAARRVTRDGPALVDALLALEAAALDGPDGAPRPR
ncbi:MAG TPA: C40 family peptidase [Gemmatimonadaceae bacterium]|nr:C40 family peptidase [Gemmatimonadaceae bacterium]